MSTAEAPLDLNRVDLSEADEFVAGPPHHIFSQMRADGPVHRNHSQHEGDFWSVVSHAEINTVLRDSETYSSARPMAFMHEENPIIPVEVLQSMLLNMDAPNHTRYRKIVRGFFSPGVMAQHEDLVARHCREIVDGIIERGECDFVEDVAITMPLAVITAVMGIENPDIKQLYDWTNILVGAQDPTLRSDDGALMQALTDIGTYIVELVEDRRDNPRDDLMSRIVHADVDGEQLEFNELIAFFILLLTAGNETSRNTLSIGWHALMEHPDQRQKLIDDPSLIGGCLDEMLRYVTPLMHFRRTATKDTELGGHAIAEGDKIIMWYASGNRDETVFERADQLEVQREIKAGSHLALGGGAHKCLGQHLARLELRSMFDELIRRVPDMELAGDIGHVRSNLFYGYTTMPVRFTPGPKTS